MHRLLTTLTLFNTTLLALCLCSCPQLQPMYCSPHLRLVESRQQRCHCGLARPAAPHQRSHCAVLQLQVDVPQHCTHNTAAAAAATIQQSASGTLTSSAYVLQVNQTGHARPSLRCITAAIQPTPVPPANKQAPLSHKPAASPLQPAPPANKLSYIPTKKPPSTAPAISLRTG